jgi:hypothetical protein
MALKVAGPSEALIQSLKCALERALYTSDVRIGREMRSYSFLWVARRGPTQVQSSKISLGQTIP